MKKEITLVNLQDEILLQVDGEEEKSHTLSWELLKKIGDNTQRLIDVIVNYSLEENKIPQEYTKLLFVGFYPGSAIPAWKLPEAPNLLFPVEKEFDKLNADIGFVLNSLNRGNFKAIADKYNEPLVKNTVIDAVYNFTNSVGSKQFRVVKKDASTKKGFKTLAKIRRMTIDHKNQLYEKVKTEANSVTNEKLEGVAKVKIYKKKDGKLSSKTSQFYIEKEAGLAVKFDSIQFNNRLYTLSGEATFSLLNPEKTIYIIESPLLDIYAYGNSIIEAEEDLFNQFDYTYTRLTNIEDSQLSEHLLKAKRFITLLVESVKEV